MQAIPEGFATITPTIICNNASDAIRLYEQAFGAKECYKMLSPESGKVMHACLQIGSSKLFLMDAMPERGMPATTASFYLYMNNVDQMFQQAKQAGLQEQSAVQDQFWGDRTGSLTDNFGNHWTIATHVRDVSDKEMQDAMKKMAA